MRVRLGNYRLGADRASIDIKQDPTFVEGGWNAVLTSANAGRSAGSFRSSRSRISRARLMSISPSVVTFHGTTGMR